MPALAESLLNHLEVGAAGEQPGSMRVAEVICDTACSNTRVDSTRKVESVQTWSVKLGVEWSWWSVAIGVVGGLVILWVALIAILWFNRPDDLRLRDTLRLLPDLLRLLRRLAADSTLPRGVRVLLWMLLGYLALPMDLVPDFIPVMGTPTMRSSSRLCCALSPRWQVPRRWNGVGRARQMA